jgi:hypothetical protein
MEPVLRLVFSPDDISTSGHRSRLQGSRAPLQIGSCRKVSTEAKNADGLGWYLNPTPLDSVEFEGSITNAFSGLATRADRRPLVQEMQLLLHSPSSL